MASKSKNKLFDTECAIRSLKKQKFNIESEIKKLDSRRFVLIKELNSTEEGIKYIERNFIRNKDRSRCNTKKSLF
jgi:predicted  nucleic acid-binding Zn-ribbon protein